MAGKKDNSTIHKMYRELVARASNISNFQVGQIRDVKYDITELANNCVHAIDSNDSYWSDVYFSALMVRYWHMIAKIYDMVKQYGVSVEEVVTVLYESLNKAMKYRSWLDDSKYISKESKGAEKVINQCITSTVSNFIKSYNIKTLDMYVENTNDDFENSVTYNDSYYDSFGCSELVQKLLNKNEYMTAMIIDLIAYKDLTSKRSLITFLNRLDNSYIRSFINKYKITDENIFLNKVEEFRNSSEREKSREVNNSFKYLKCNEELVRSFIC